VSKLGSSGNGATEAMVVLCHDPGSNSGGRNIQGISKRQEGMMAVTVYYRHVTVDI